MYNNYPYNPYMFNNTTMPQNAPISPYNRGEQMQGNLLKVNGLDGAKAFQMPPNSTVALFDANNDVFYIKSSDAGGFSNIRSFSFNAIDNAPAEIDKSQFVTRAEFEELRGLVNGKQHISESKNVAGNAEQN